LKPSRQHGTHNTEKKIMYSEKSKTPWGALIVGVAVLVFGCIIGGVLLIRNFSGSGQLVGAVPGSTEAVPAGSVVIDIASSNTKENWMDVVIAQFNAENHQINSGETIFVRVTHVTSGGSQQDILDGKSQPTVWSPGDQSWVDGANAVWRDRNGRPLVSEACPQTVLAPSGFALWRPMAEALGWPDTPISWDDLVQLSANPDGWASIGHPEWGNFKFGHTHPAYSNVGLQMMTALAYSTLGTTSGLRTDDVYSTPVVDAFHFVEQNTWHYGIQSRTLMNAMVVRGPNYLHGITTSEAETLKTNEERGDELQFPLVFIFPAEGTFWSEQPYCIVNADWVSDEQTEAAGIFRDYLLARPQQELAIDNFLRPVDETIALHAPLSLEDGTDPRVTTKQVPALESPSAEVAEAVKDVFFQTKKKATVILVLDTSGSMRGDKIKNAVESAVNFVGRLDPNDEVFVITFGGESEDIIQLQQGGRAGDVGENLIDTLRGLFAEGNTPLYDAVCQANDLVMQLQTENEGTGERRLYGVILLSDGDDTSSSNTQNQMFNCLPSGEDVEGTKFFTIAYGEDADADLMLRIANRTNGQTFTGGPENIDRIYNSISAEQ
jgi:Ca-activated chloride channel family protein